MIVLIPQLICCGINTKSEILSDYSAPASGRSVPARAPHSRAPPATEVNGTG